ncbi:MAG: sigma-54-dependent Fis family transcriptional regulator [Desulfobacterales bacterium]|nr:sigma-54-dependent Fis family transcriptional regulator [Desulfobacterales bacterium]
MQTPILVVDDEKGLLLSVRATLLSAGLPEPVLESDARLVVDLVRKHNFQLVLLDLIMPHLSGIDLLQQIKKEFPTTECIIITAIDDTSTAIQAMKYGAYDYIVKPIDSEKLVIAIRHALERFNLKHGLALYKKKPSFAELKYPEVFESIITEDEEMARVFHQVEGVAPTDYTVFITGESGTGKEMLASVIHQLSKRKNQPFLAVNMAAFSGTLFEDEFFGHVKGSFTGALEDKKGFFERAEGGTLFLDEITELDPVLQVKLLRVIQEGELYRIGSTKVKNVDVRIITASNRDIEAEIKQGKFRADLFHRLNMFNIIVPPLRERGNDILLLANHFLNIHAKQNQKNISRLDKDLIQALLMHPLKGNIRELENIISSAIVREKSNILQLSSTNLSVKPDKSAEDKDSELITLFEMEKRYIQKIFSITGGNRTHAARILGIGLRTLQRKLKILDSPPPTSE